ncbi:MAG: hypothetical protein H7Z19_11385 [Chitinophagaceae bacterium]|nr:hypothetical protein [Rubrivivax sp.]
MAKRSKTTGLPIINPRARAIDIGSRFHVVAVPVEMDDDPVQTFQAFMADWLKAVGVTTAAFVRRSHRDRC